MKVCSLESCEKKHYAKGFCEYHYKRSKLDNEKRVKKREYDNKYRRTEKGLNNNRKNKSIRRAKKESVAVIESFSPKEVFENGYYVCCICGHPINPLLRYPDLLSVSLEHKIAISKGGAHSIENCAPSHLICNIKRNNKDIQPSFEGVSI